MPTQICLLSVGYIAEAEILVTAWLGYKGLKSVDFEGFELTNLVVEEDHLILGDVIEYGDVLVVVEVDIYRRIVDSIEADMVEVVLEGFEILDLVSKFLQSIEEIDFEVRKLLRNHFREPVEVDQGLLEIVVAFLRDRVNFVIVLDVLVNLDIENILVVYVANGGVELILEVLYHEEKVIFFVVIHRTDYFCFYIISCLL